jgi:hypothetical protein
LAKTRAASSGVSPAGGAALADALALGPVPVPPDFVQPGEIASSTSNAA